jgi:hypothetical protein
MAMGLSYDGYYGTILECCLLAAVCCFSSTITFPWDEMLMEATFLTLFMPALPPVTTQWAAASPPAPILAFLYRWLVFRVIAGFGKKKFIGSTAKVRHVFEVA